MTMHYKFIIKRMHMYTNKNILYDDINQQTKNNLLLTKKNKKKLQLTFI